MKPCSNSRYNIRTICLSQEAIQYPFLKPAVTSLVHKDPYTLNNKKILRKLENNKFYPKTTKIRVRKNIAHHSINSRNYAAAYYQILEEIPGPLLPEKIKNMKKLQTF